MPFTAPINWLTVEDAIYDWFTAATGLPRVIWSRYHVPQLSYPYGALQIIAGPTVVAGSDEIRNVTNLAAPTGQEIQQIICGMREVTVSCQVLQSAPGSQSPGSSAGYYLSLAQSSLSATSVLEIFRGKGISIISQGNAVQFDEPVEDAWIQRAALDVRFGIAANTYEYAGYIDKIEVSSAVAGLVNVIMP